MNKTLNKLIILRKNNNLSQQYVADILQIDVIEFLRYENGSLPLSNELLNTLANIYNVSITDLTNDNIEYKEIINDYTNKINININNTLNNKPYNKYKYIIPTILLSILLIFILITSNNDTNNKDISLNLTRDKSIYLYGNTYGLLNYNEDKLEFNGIDYNNQFNFINRNDIAKIQVNDHITAVLSNTGKLSLYGGDKQNYKVDYTKLYKDISLGDSHLLLLDSNNNLDCIKSTNIIEPCIFNNDITNTITNIYANEDYSIIIDNNLNIYTSNIDLNINNINKPLKQIVGNRDNLWFVYIDSNIEKIIGHRYNNIQKDNIRELILLNDALIALTNDNKIIFEATNNKYDYVNEWENVLDIISLNETLIGYSNNKILSLDEELDDIDKVEGKPSNINFNITNNNFNITFDSCINCIEYEIKILENNYSISTNRTSVIVPNQQFVDNNVYTIVVTGIGKYDESESSSIQFTYYTPHNEPDIIPTPVIIPSIIPSNTPTPTIEPTLTPNVTPTITTTPNIQPSITPTIN